MNEYSIHQFSKKLLQKSVFPHLKAYLKGQVGNPAPVSINLDLTTACNFQCPHCIDAEIINKGKMLDLQYVKELLGDWSKKGLRSVILIGGGEPTLYPYFEEVVRFLKKLHLQVGIVSNGTNMGKIENICRILGGKDWVRLSLDAGKNTTFQKIHCPKVRISLREIMAAAKRMRKINKDLQLGYSFLIIGDGKKAGQVSLVKNIGEISLTAKLAKENGFNYLSLKPFINPDGVRETVISSKNLREIKAEIKKARKLEDKNFKAVESINLLCFYDKKLNEMMSRQPKICHSQFFRSVVIPSGIYNCSLWRGFASTKIAESNQKLTPKYYQGLGNSRKKILQTFNAQKICKEVNCLYAPLNCWIEGLIKHPEEIKKLKPIADFNDYFL